MAKKKEQEHKEANFEATKSENQQLYEELTNKNQDYVFQLNSRLEALDYDPIKKEYVLNEMLHEIIKGQRESVPARKLYGTPTERADEILGANVEIPVDDGETSPTWMLYMDGALLLGGLFGIVNGIGSMRSTEVPVGLLQVIMNFVLGGLAMLVLTKYSPKPGQTKGMFKYIAATVGVMLFWVLVLTLILEVLPNALNPTLPSTLVIGIGAVAIAAKWYLKRKLDIKGTLF